MLVRGWDWGIIVRWVSTIPVIEGEIMKILLETNQLKTQPFVRFELFPLEID